MEQDSLTDLVPGKGLRVRVHDKFYDSRARRQPLFRNLSLDINLGDFVSILGPSGCGKTTLLRMVAGLDRDFDGEISIGSEIVVSPGRDRSLVFQHANLLPWMTVRQNISFALDSTIPEWKKMEMIQKSLRVVELDQAGDLMVHELSGGMRKRAALARAIADPPKTLLLDEPFGALDFYTREAIQDNIARIQTERHLTTLMVTHDLDEAIYLSDRIIVFSSAPTAVIADLRVDLNHPRNRSEAAFLGYYHQLRDVIKFARNHHE